VVLAGGSGVRSGFSRPKQLVKLGGRPLIAHALERFQSHPGISEIAVIASPASVSEIESLINRDHLTKVKKVLLGGNERYESSISAIRAYEEDAEREDIRLLFHDAVRPLISHTIISNVIEALNHYGAVDTAIPSSDTIISVDEATGTIDGIPDRRLLRMGQTPQGFHYSVIKAAYDRALLDANFRTTDDCGVVLKYAPEHKIVVVPGESLNRKLTYADDLLVLDKFLQTGAGKRMTAQVDTIVLSGLKGRTIVVFGGTSGIGASICKLAHAFGATVVASSRSNGVDIRKSADIRAVLEKAKNDFGKIDAIVNTAAVLTRQPLASMAEGEIEESISINFLGAVNVASESHMFLSETKGHLLFFSSSSYTYGRAFYSTYSSSKAAVVNLTQALADEWNDEGIKVNCVNPERAHTPMRTKAFGIEPPDSLLCPDEVARKALGILIGSTSGFIYDIVKT
jgi:2-C-methyl-D-erythritol 4-phosphate cytidylyltransferase